MRASHNCQCVFRVAVDWSASPEVALEMKNSKFPDWNSMRANDRNWRKMRRSQCSRKVLSDPKKFQALFSDA